MGLFSKRTPKKPKADAAQASVEPTAADAPSKKDKRSKAKAKKPKRSFFGGKKKKELTLIERMQLEESVAASSLDVVQELVNLHESAVRETSDGLLIVAITNDILEKAELDPASEEFGSFAEALRSETIESIALGNDLANGIIGIIPSQETLLALDEFDFAHDLEFRWALVPFDLGDDDQLTLLNGTVHLDRLLELAHDQGIELSVDNGEVTESDAGEAPAPGHAPYDTSSEDDGVQEDDEPEDEVGPSDAPEDDSDGVEEPDDEIPDDDMPPDDEFPDDDQPEPTDSFPDEFPNEEEEPLDDELDVPLDDDAGALPVTDVEDAAAAEETKEAINRTVEHVFNNTELELSIDMTKFDDYFDAVTIAKFDTTQTDDSELQHVLSKLRQDANSELLRFHQDNVQSLRNKFTTSMRDMHSKLAQALDHKNETTVYGSRYHEIESEYKESTDDLDRRVAKETESINKAYTENREDFAENAKREAYAVYDSRHRDERNAQVEAARDHVETDIKTTRDLALGELYKDRRAVAARLFDKATTALLQSLQEEYRNVSRKELQMYDAFRKDMDVYLRKHFADEVLRAKAEAEQLKQSHEAERVRVEYEQMLMTKARQLEEADKQAREAVRQLDAAHKEQLDHVKADYERRIDREQRDNKELREMLQDSNKANSRIGEQKDKEIEHRLKMYEDQIQSKNLELSYANERAKQSQRPIKFIIVAAAAVALALGIIFGFLFGASSAQKVAPGTSNAQKVSLVQPSHVQTVTVDRLDA